MEQTDNLLTYRFTCSQIKKILTPVAKTIPDTIIVRWIFYIRLCENEIFPELKIKKHIMWPSELTDNKKYQKSFD